MTALEDVENIYRCFAAHSGNEHMTIAAAIALITVAETADIFSDLKLFADKVSMTKMFIAICCDLQR